MNLSFNETDQAPSNVILPVFHANMVMASHEIYCALERMRHTPCVKQEDFEKLVDIYNQLGDLSEKIIKDSLKGE